MVKQLFQDFLGSSTSQYASQSDVEQQCPDLEDLAWDTELSTKRSEEGWNKESEAVRSIRSSPRLQRTLRSRLFESVLRPALRSICLVTCCIGCPQDTFFKSHDMQLGKPEEDEVVLRIINAEEQPEPETDEDWEAVSDGSGTSWGEERRTSVIPTSQRGETSESELKITYYDEEDKEEEERQKRQSSESNSVLIGPSKGFTRCSRNTAKYYLDEDALDDAVSPTRSKTVFGTLKFKDASPPPALNSDHSRCVRQSNASETKVVSVDNMLSSEWDP